uniref:Uncharacterized protein n=1 Tax=Cucumis melo TaxID=3656 RepID=A0A9I9EJ71_CUCME
MWKTYNKFPLEQLSMMRIVWAKSRSSNCHESKNGENHKENNGLLSEAASWIDPLKNRINPDVFEVVQNNEEEKTKLEGREVFSLWSLAKSKANNLTFEGAKSSSQPSTSNLNTSESIFIQKVLPESIGAVKPYLRQFIDV